MKRSPRPQPDTDLSGALHEVSNALTVVLGWVNEARAKAPAGPVRDALEIAYTHAQRGYSVARGAIAAGASAALTSSAAKWKKPQPDERGPARSAAVVANEAIQAVAPQAEVRGVSLVATGNDVEQAIEASDAVLQILVNLLLNAVAFTPNGGQVSLSISSQGNSVAFRVADDGPGVPLEHHRDLFERRKSMRPGGAGIGLSHSHALAARHGGRLQLLPSAKGARFELSWPASDAPSRTVQSVSLAALNGRRVLVLEDDLAVLTMVQMGLSARGVEVLSACSIEELREVLERGIPFDAAFIDLSPIQADPGGAVQLLKRGNAELPVILISGSATGISDELPLAGWVQKPFEVGELCRALADAIGSSAQDLEKAV
ncbi:MAG TPA: ATP-binding protein [Polyangiaceae bacterium]|nr:ATP-binding protein [Polyangiaceae bacterium]